MHLLHYSVLYEKNPKERGTSDHSPAGGTPDCLQPLHPTGCVAHPTGTARAKVTPMLGKPGTAPQHPLPHTPWLHRGFPHQHSSETPEPPAQKLDGVRRAPHGVPGPAEGNPPRRCRHTPPPEGVPGGMLAAPVTWDDVPFPEGSGQRRDAG